MTKKNGVVELLEHELRWYYRAPIMIAVAGIILAIFALIKGDHFYLITGGIIFLVGLGVQWILGSYCQIWCMQPSGNAPS
jgi:hypothetical protein